MSVIQSAPEIARARTSVASKPSRRRYLWAVVVMLVGFLGALQWSFAILRASDAEADNFGRGEVPGTLTVELHPGTWFVYEEAGAAVRGIEVTGPDGAAVPVDDVSKGMLDFKGYDRSGSPASAVGVLRVEPGEMGEYTITVTGDDEFGDGTFAIGEEDVVTFRRNQTLGVMVVLVVTVGTGIAIAAGTYRRRRHVL